MEVLLVDLFHRHLPGQGGQGKVARRSQRETESRTLVLMATMRSPWSGSQRQTDLRPHLRQEAPTSAGNRPIFPHGRRPRGTEELTWKSAQPSSPLTCL